jgi:hypothetical protein
MSNIIALPKNINPPPEYKLIRSTRQLSYYVKPELYEQAQVYVNQLSNLPDEQFDNIFSQMRISGGRKKKSVKKQTKPRKTRKTRK